MPLIIPTNSISALGYDVANSLRFNRDNIDKLTRTFSSGNRRTYTISSWVKRSRLGIDYQGINIASGGDEGIFFDSSDRINLFFGGGGANVTKAVYRDVSAWYHIVVAIDTTQSTGSDRIKLYVNGIQETSWSATSTPVQNYDTLFNNSGGTNVIGSHSITTSYSFDGYMAESVFIDGQALDPTSFGEFDEDSGIWKPKAVSGLTFGNNGFYLDFENSGSLGADVSGNGNNFTVNNLTSIDQTTDTPTNNYATFNALQPTSATFSNGNTDVISGSAAWYTAPATLGVTSGKYYWEVKAGTISGSNYIQAGVCSESSASANLNTYHANTTYSYAYHWDGQKYINNSASSFGTAISTGDIIMIALDCDNGFIYAGLNGTWQNSGNPTSGGSGTGAMTTLASNQLWFPTVSAYSSTHNANFGNPAFTISSGNSDGNGYGNFEYSVPSGYYSLNTKNLAEYG